MALAATRIAKVRSCRKSSKAKVLPKPHSLGFVVELSPVKVFSSANADDKGLPRISCFGEQLKVQHVIGLPLGNKFLGMILFFIWTLPHKDFEIRSSSAKSRLKQ